MQVRSLELHNFRGFRHALLSDLKSLIIIVGENDSGKSTLLEALKLLLKDSQGTLGQPFLGKIEGMEYLWFGADPHQSAVDIVATLDLSENDRRALQQASGTSAFVSSGSLKVSLEITCDESERAYRRWREIQGEGLPPIHNDPQTNNPAFDVDGSLQREIEMEGAKVDVFSIAQALERLLEDKLRLIGLPRERADVSGESRWWERLPMLPSETEESIKRRAKPTPPSVVREWNRYRSSRGEVVGSFDVKEGMLIFDKRIGDDQIPMPLTLKGGGHQTYLHLLELMTRGGADIIVIEEPENHLHPKLIRRFMADVENLCRGGKQVFIATHSPFVVNRSASAGLWYVWQESGEAHVSNILGKQDLRERLVDLGVRPSDFLLANGLLVVEGASDRIFLTGVARVLGKSFEDMDIMVMDAGGDSKEGPHIEFWSEITRNAPLLKFAILDGGSASQKERLIKGGVAGENVFILERRDIEDYYPRPLIVQWVAQVLGNELVLSEEDLPVGDTVAILKERLRGKTAWRKTQLAGYVGSHLTAKLVDTELKKHLEDIWNKVAG